MVIPGWPSFYPYEFSLPLTSYIQLLTESWFYYQHIPFPLSLLLCSLSKLSSSLVWISMEHRTRLPYFHFCIFFSLQSKEIALKWKSEITPHLKIFECLPFCTENKVQTSFHGLHTPTWHNSFLTSPNSPTAPFFHTGLLKTPRTHHTHWTFAFTHLSAWMVPRFVAFT